MVTSSPKRILITGASSGIGRALALHYARPGVFLALTGRSLPRLKDVAEECEKVGAQAVYSALDITDRAAVKGWVGSVQQAAPLDLVIANAGISGGTGGLPNGESVEQARWIFDVNLGGVLNTVDAVLPVMMAAGRGQIALMSSLAGFCGWHGAPAYSASKGAVRLYAEGLRGSLRPAGVQVSVICPGFVDTPMTAVNPYAMPFMMSAPRAAAVIARGLERNKGRIAFPWPMYMLAGVIGILPDALAEVVLSQFPAKPKGQDIVTQGK